MFEDDSGSGDGSENAGDGERAADPGDHRATAAGDDRSETVLEETFETTEHEPDPPEFDVTSGEDLVERLPTGSDAPAEVQKSFWGMVVLLKVALIALSLGAMFAYFRGEFAIAAGLGVLGGLATVRLVLRVRAYGEGE